MNKIYPDLIWYGDITAWWRRKENICCNIEYDDEKELLIYKNGCEDGVEWDNACEIADDPRHSGRINIDNGKFKLWAEALFRSKGIDNPDTLLAEHLVSPDEHFVI